jgi:hypothetical protein
MWPVASSVSANNDRAVGVLITESLRLGSTSAGLGLIVDKITRVAPAEPVPGQPPTWTLIEFSVEATWVDTLARSLAEALDTGPWYVEFHTHAETFVVFHGRIFRFPRDDSEQHDIAAAYGRGQGVPDEQLDWAR